MASGFTVFEGSVRFARNGHLGGQKRPVEHSRPFYEETSRLVGGPGRLFLTSAAEQASGSFDCLELPNEIRIFVVESPDQFLENGDLTGFDNFEDYRPSAGG